jgi:hypothetical protein
MTLPRGNDYPRETPRYAVEVWRVGGEDGWEGSWVIVRDRLTWAEARNLAASYRAADLARIVTR